MLHQEVAAFKQKYEKDSEELKKELSRLEGLQKEYDSKLRANSQELKSHRAHPFLSSQNYQREREYLISQREKAYVAFKQEFDQEERHDYELASKVSGIQGNEQSIKESQSVALTASTPFTWLKPKHTFPLRRINTQERQASFHIIEEGKFKSEGREEGIYTKPIADFDRKKEQPGMWMAMDPEVNSNATFNLPPAQEDKPPPYSCPFAFGLLSTEMDYQSEPLAEANFQNKRQTSEVEATANPKFILEAKFAEKGGSLSSAQEDKLPQYSNMSTSETAMTQAVHASSEPPAEANFHREPQVSKVKQAANPKVSF